MQNNSTNPEEKQNNEAEVNNALPVANNNNVPETAAPVANNAKKRNLGKIFLAVILLVASLGGLVTYYLVNNQARQTGNNGQSGNSFSGNAQSNASQTTTQSATTSVEPANPTPGNRLNLTTSFSDLNRYFRQVPTNFYTFRGFTPSENLNANVRFVEREKIAVAELYLANYVADEISESNWSGNRREAWPSIEIPQSLLSDLEKINNDRNSNLEIPDAEKALYSSSENVSEIKSDILEAYDEFVAFLRYRNVNEAYIEEFITNTHPKNEDRFIYVNNTSINVPPTVNEKYEKSESDFSQRQITFYPVDIYNRTRSLKSSGIIGTDPKLLRRFATKFLTYHELMHSLQRTVDTVNAPAAQKQLKSNYVYARFSLRTIESSKQKSWGSESENLIQNADINSESQADGMAFEIASAVFGLSESQQRLFWEFEFGRLAEASALYDRLFDKFPEKYPEFYMADFGTKILTDIVNKMPISDDSRLLNRVSGRLGGLGAYGGYLNPVTPNESSDIWRSLEDL